MIYFATTRWGFWMWIKDKSVKSTMKQFLRFIKKKEQRRHSYDIGSRKTKNEIRYWSKMTTLLFFLWIAARNIYCPSHSCFIPHHFFSSIPSRQTFFATFSMQISAFFSTFAVVSPVTIDTFAPTSFLSFVVVSYVERLKENLTTYFYKRLCLLWNHSQINIPTHWHSSFSSNPNYLPPWLVHYMGILANLPSHNNAKSLRGSFFDVVIRIFFLFRNGRRFAMLTKVNSPQPSPLVNCCTFSFN